MEDGSREPLLERTSSHHLYSSWFLLSILSLTLGLVQTIPLAVLVPESLNLGLSMSEASLIIAAWPISSLLTLALQPYLNHVPSSLFFVGLGAVEALGFASFYLSVRAGTWYIWLAVLARFTTGTTHFLICNKVAVGITVLLTGDVNKSSLTWEIFNSVGQAVGAYIGSVICVRWGFSITMVMAGALLFVTVVVAAMVFPTVPASKQESGSDVAGLYWLHVSRDQVSSSAKLLSHLTC